MILNITHHIVKYEQFHNSIPIFNWRCLQSI